MDIVSSVVSVFHVVTQRPRLLHLRGPAWWPLGLCHCLHPLAGGVSSMQEASSLLRSLGLRYGQQHFFKKFIHFIYFWLRWVLVAVHGLSLVAASEGYSSLRCAASHCGGFSCGRARALGAWPSVVVACGLGSCGSWA